MKFVYHGVRYPSTLDSKEMMVEINKELISLDSFDSIEMTPIELNELISSLISLPKEDTETETEPEDIEDAEIKTNFKKLKNK